MMASGTPSKTQDKAKEIAFFDRHAQAQEYDVFTPRSSERLIAAFIRLTGLGKGARVADLGEWVRERLRIFCAKPATTPWASISARS